MPTEEAESNSQTSSVREGKQPAQSWDIGDEDDIAYGSPIE
jgi:hypothetical protein